MSSTTCHVDGKGTEPRSSQSDCGRRSDKYWLEHKKFLLDEEIFTLSLMEPWRSRGLNYTPPGIPSSLSYFGIGRFDKK